MVLCCSSINNSPSPRICWQGQQSSRLPEVKQDRAPSKSVVKVSDDASAAVVLSVSELNRLKLASVIRTADDVAREVAEAKEAQLQRQKQANERKVRLFSSLYPELALSGPAFPSHSHWLLLPPPVPVLQAKILALESARKAAIPPSQLEKEEMEYKENIRKRGERASDSAVAPLRPLPCVEIFHLPALYDIFFRGSACPCVSVCAWVCVCVCVCLSVLSVSVCLCECLCLFLCVSLCLCERVCV